MQFLSIGHLRRALIQKIQKSAYFYVDQTLNVFATGALSVSPSPAQGQMPVILYMRSEERDTIRG